VRRPVALDEDVVGGLEAVRARPAEGAHGGRLLFVHGLFGGAWVWQHYLEYFAARGWQGWAVNLRGHGRSPVPGAGRLCLGDDVADVTAAAGALGDPVLVGHSLGGLLALKVAEQRGAPAVIALTPAPPRGIFALRSLTLLAAAVRYAPGMIRGASLMPRRRLIDRLALHRLDPAERERVWRRLVPESGRRALGVVLPGLPVRAERLRCPRLIVAAAADRLTPCRMVRRIARRYGAACYEYEGLGHMVPLERQWRLVAADLAAWLESVGRQRARVPVTS
jgi:pimeloyl-ACP methyl ester carboxylesterase